MKRMAKILLIVLMTVFISGCAKHKVFSIESFNLMLKNAKMASYDVTKDLPSSANIEKGSIGVSDDGWRIEYYIFKNVEDAKSVYNDNKLVFSKEDKISVDRIVNEENYSKYYAVSDKYYMVVVQVKNAVVYAKVEKQYQTNIDNLLTKMGY